MGQVHAANAHLISRLTALYLVDHVDETPGVKSLQCMIGISRPDCPRYGEQMKELQSKLDDLVKKSNAAEGKLTNLKDIENSVDEVTLFETHDDPNSTYTVTVGTVYSKLVEPDISPEYFCYIGLDRGNANEDRNLHFHNRSGSIKLNADTLRKTGVSSSTLKFAASVCKPFVIGDVR